jgi:hypothetical protein
MMHRVEVEFQDFGWRALNEAAESQGVSVEEVIQHAAMYYLASADEGRVSHGISATEHSSAAASQL